MTHTRTYTYSTLDIPHIPEAVYESPFGLFVLFGEPSDRRVQAVFTRKVMGELEGAYHYLDMQIPWALCDSLSEVNKPHLRTLKVNALPTILWLAAPSITDSMEGKDAFLESQYHFQVPDYGGNLSDPVYILVREVGTVFTKKITADVEKMISTLGY